MTVAWAAVAGWGQTMNRWQLVGFRAAWAILMRQTQLSLLPAKNAVLAAHDDTCVECHNDDQRPRCPLRLLLMEAMEGGQ